MNRFVRDVARQLAVTMTVAFVIGQIPELRAWLRSQAGMN